MNKPADRHQPMAIPPETVNKILDNQERELALRSREFDLREKEDANRYEFSKKALEAQVENSKSIRDHERRKLKMSYWLAFGITAIAGSTIAISLFLGKEQYAMEILKSAVYLLSGGVSGYGLHAIRSKKDDRHGE